MLHRKDNAFFAFTVTLKTEELQKFIIAIYSRDTIRNTTLSVPSHVIPTIGESEF